MGLKVKVVEKSGLALKRTVVKSNPFKKNDCQRNSCDFCETHDINCKTREVIYKISCTGTNKDGNSCEAVDYEGETSRSIGERFMEHLEKMHSKNKKTREKSFIYDHAQTDHNGSIPPVKVEILAQCLGDPGLRQAMEAVRIREDKPALNGKEEWTNQPRKRNEKKKKSNEQVTSLQ